MGGPGLKDTMCSLTFKNVCFFSSQLSDLDLGNSSGDLCGPKAFFFVAAKQFEEYYINQEAASLCALLFSCIDTYTGKKQNIEMQSQDSNV